MKSAVVIRHVAFEDLGNLTPTIQEHGYQVQYYDAGLDPIESIDPLQPDLVVVLGGPIGVYEDEDYPFVNRELALLERRLEHDHPTLGICLGAQLMARALGAKVYPGHGKEIGWNAVRLSNAGRASPLGHLDNVELLHWHGDTFDLPAGAVHLASTATYRNQAFLWGKRGLALQFHPEVELRSLERWYVGHACEISATAGVSVKSLRADATRFAPRLLKPAQLMCRAWLLSL